MMMLREQFGISFPTNNQNLQSNLNRHPRGMLKYRLERIKDEELVRTSSGIEKTLTRLQ